MPAALRAAVVVAEQPQRATGAAQAVAVRRREGQRAWRRPRERLQRQQRLEPKPAL